ncbi:MAG: MltA domain-containing protein [Desulfovibrionales bacterium]|nr:MltA domain-containing protein [Desulfovibrionales bacterium]
MTTKLTLRTTSVLILITLFCFAGCAKRQAPIQEPTAPAEPVVTQPEGERFIRLSDREACEVVRSITLSQQYINSWTDLTPAIKRSAYYVSKKPQDKLALDRYGLQVSWGTLRTSLQQMAELLPRLDANPELLAQHFTFYRLDSDPQFTGYYEPALEASLTRKAGYSYPIYGVPNDLLQLDLGQFHPRWQGQRTYYRMQDGKAVPYYDRKAIDVNGALATRNLEIAWAKNPLDIFFLQIQGSGRLLLEDGTTKHILYAGKNGQRYVSLGKVMRDKGLLPKDGISMQAIRKYFDNNPKQTFDLLSSNPSYVFFRLSDSGPYGSIGQPLTPRVSFATDPSYLPLGGMMLFSVALPQKDAEGKFQYGDEITGFGLAQDTGGAIKAHHVDFFSGYGKNATWVAGHMNKTGAMWLLLPKKL